MTIEQINGLKLDDYLESMQYRIWVKIDPKPEDMPEFTLPELEVEFLLFKSELIAAENERLRKQDLKDRFESLTDMRAAFHNLHDEPNPGLWLKNLLLRDPSSAEIDMAALEAKDIEIQNDPKKIKADYIQARNDEYAAEGVSRDLILEALWEAVVENRPDKINALQPIREKVKTKIPKPGK